MGLFNTLATALGLRKREVNVIVVGLDNSGKSTILNHLKPDLERAADIVPTVGFNVERFKGTCLLGRGRPRGESVMPRCRGRRLLVQSESVVGFSIQASPSPYNQRLRMARPYDSTACR